MSEQREQPEQLRCVCGSAYFDDVQWVVRYFIGCAGATNSAGEIIVPVAHCPGECGCRLSVVDGEPRVGEPYADLERDAKRFRAVEEDVHEGESLPGGCPDEPSEWSFETYRTRERYATLGEYADALLGGDDGRCRLTGSRTRR